MAVSPRVRECDISDIALQFVFCHSRRYAEADHLTVQIVGILANIDQSCWERFFGQRPSAVSTTLTMVAITLSEPVGEESKEDLASDFREIW
jgi:hypothetical protein